MDALARSGLSLAAFERREGLDVQRLRRWARRLDAPVTRGQKLHERRSNEKELLRFIEVAHAKDIVTTIEVVLLCGRVLRVQDSIAPAMLRKLVDALDEGDGQC
jgi:hypothetical protein